MSKNSISVVTTVDNLQSPVGPLVAIITRANVHNASTANAFIGDGAVQAATHDKPDEHQRAAVTLVGETSAAHFLNWWSRLASDDTVLSAFMSQMGVADMISDTTAGTPLETVSLLSQAARSD
jgi:hypothetical protein